MTHCVSLAYETEDEADAKGAKRISVSIGFKYWHPYLELERSAYINN